MQTFGSNSDGILAQSIGGGGGNGGFAIAGNISGGAALDISMGGSGGSGAYAGGVNVTSSSTIATEGDLSSGLVAQSLGGGGGNGGFAISAGGSTGLAASLAFGGNAGRGGYASDVNVVNTGVVTTQGNLANGILAQSVGGGGGNGGFTVAATLTESSAVTLGFGGNGGTGGYAGNVYLTNLANVGTSGTSASAIVAQSIGGGGGNGGFNVSAGITGGYGITLGFGGTGDSGGYAQAVNVTSGAAGAPVTILTSGSQSSGIVAQSIGGGGGNGGWNVTGSMSNDPTLALSYGGTGGTGGYAGSVTVASNSNISTTGDQSDGIIAQSIGGGGGNGGFSIGAGLSTQNAFAFTFGGEGNSGNTGGSVLVTSGTPQAAMAIETQGSHSAGILAQSIGGGGGNGGFAVGLNGTSGDSFSYGFNLGSDGGSGANASTVTVASNTQIATFGANSNGISAQSIGGGGGNAAFSASGSASPTAVAGSFGFGSGGGAGNADAVNVGSLNTIVTHGDNSIGILAQSVGGGGGYGGSALPLTPVSAAATLVGFGMGNNCATGASCGGNAGNVTLTNSGSIETYGANAGALIAQSLGGGGGDGGFSISGGLSSESSISTNIGESIGANGGVGGNAANVTVNNSAQALLTNGSQSDGILAQSVGGGGGNGGFSISGTVDPGWGLNFSLGGSGGSGGTAGIAGVTNAATIGTLGNLSDGIAAQSIGGGGGNGGFSIAAQGAMGLAANIAVGGAGGSGNNGDAVTVTNGGIVTTQGGSSNGILAQSIGGGGGNSGWVVAVALDQGNNASIAYGTSGGSGGSASTATVNNTASIQTLGNSSNGIEAQSLGGGGGNGGFAVNGGLSGGKSLGLAFGGAGGTGSNSDTVTVNSGATASAVTILTSGDFSNGVLAQSVGGGGGNGGFDVAGTISQGASFSLAYGGSGGSGGYAGSANVTSFTNIQTTGASSAGIVAQSIGGGGGNGGFSVGADLSTSNALGVTFGGDGGSGNTANTVTVQSGDASTAVAIYTSGENSDGILAQSIGGGGGNGGFAVGAVATSGDSFSKSLNLGSGGGSGATSNDVNVTSNTLIWTQGDNSAGIAAQSIGGGGGNAAFSVKGSISANGASGSFKFGTGGNAANAGSVDVTSSNTILTYGENADGILAQSIGGGGGYGGLSMGGQLENAIGLNLGNACASCGGNASSVGVISSGIVQTQGDNSAAIVAQSIGGGGGAGGFAINAGLKTQSGLSNIGLAVGSAGGEAGNGLGVTVNSTGASLITHGAQSDGILAQSVGGGGGNGGFAISGQIAPGWGMNFGVGGGAGAGGSSSLVSVTNSSEIATIGDLSDGIAAQSIGGGGGTGGFAISAQGASGLAGNFAIGGSGGSGNGSGEVDVTNGGVILTGGNSSNGILAQSIGGGGGNSGFAVAGSLDTSSSNTSLAFGTAGGDGGSAGVVNVTTNASIQTLGNASNGIVAQSLGGGGGNGGFAVNAGISGSNSIALAMGGKGGSGSGASAVTVDAGSAANVVEILTNGTVSDGILAQSIGGGGGNGGFAIDGAITQGTSLTLAMGGSGGSGSTSDTVTVSSVADIQTIGDDSSGIVAQSIGGGGGNGGFSIGNDASLSGKALTLSFGGSGGDGNTASMVAVSSGSAQSATSIFTNGANADGILAQSIGGGGGNGGMSIGLAETTQTMASGFGLGAGAGSGDDAGTVGVTNYSTIATNGANAVGISAQSIGGGGGNGGLSVSGSLKNNGAKASFTYGSGGSGGAGMQVGVTNTGALQTLGNNADGILAQSIGGGGGYGSLGLIGNVATDLGISYGADNGGGSAALVSVTNSGSIATGGNNANAIEAQSIGGGGGEGAFSVSLGLSSSPSATNRLTKSFGASGGSGGNGGQVDVANTSSFIYTTGSESDGILAQSIGGGGGDGGFAVAGSISGGWGVGVSMGGSGGSGGTADNVTVANSGEVLTFGDLSSGIVAQSIGGGGGNGGFAVLATGSLQTQADVALGGKGGSGSSSSTVSVTNSGLVITHGDLAGGIVAQSIGGGGGNAGFALAASISQNYSTAFSLGGAGGAGSNGGEVDVDNEGQIETFGTSAAGIIAQSIGGGGGNGAFAASAGFSGQGGIGLAFGGSAGSGGNGLAVNVLSGTSASDTVIITNGVNANGVLAQSIGGGGGNGGVAAAGVGANGPAFGFSMGGNGGSGGSGDAVSVQVNSAIATYGDFANGVVAQSIGGGGGNGAIDATGAGSSQLSSAIGVGGSGGAGGGASTVSLINQGQITTQGTNANGIVAQSIGGGGGNGGISIAGSISQTNAFGVAVGGSGASGGAASSVTVQNGGSIVTNGQFADGIIAQSIGGGGGNGAASIGGALSNSSGIGVGVGGNGGNGGDAGNVSVTNAYAGQGGVIVTNGAGSVGILAQSIGGGGGSGGLGIGGSIDASSQLAIVLGASNGTVGSGGNVTVSNDGTILANGTDAVAVEAQSIGGGGGVVTVNLGGGFSQNGGDMKLALGSDETMSTDMTGGTVGLTNSGNVQTTGNGSHGVLEQSIGGGGGQAALSGTLANALSDNATLSISAGGYGGADTSAQNLTASNSGMVLTSGIGANAVFAQSIGGGGGDAGYALLADLGANAKAANLSIAIGGTGGSASAAGTISLTTSGVLQTLGENSVGLLAQSIGGGGGTGGFTANGTFATSNAATQFNVAVGGTGGTQNDAAAIAVTNQGTVLTFGNGSSGIETQAIGGGGGDAGMTISGAFAGSSAKSIAETVGGADSGNGAAITLANVGAIQTGTQSTGAGTGSNGLLAQSIGGGGGNGSIALSQLALGTNGEATTTNVNVTAGGAVGSNGFGDAIGVKDSGAISTFGAASNGLAAQSIGAGGGNAAFTFCGCNANGSNLGAATIALNAVLGDPGSANSTGGNVSIDHTNGEIYTSGKVSNGVLMQSIGGGGGTITSALNSAIGTYSLNATIGAKGGTGNSSGTLDLQNAGAIVTTGELSNGILAQSIGGGGGTLASAYGGASAANVSLGGNAASGNGGAITIANIGDVYTQGTSSSALFAQSIGGGGGSFVTNATNANNAFTLGGSNGAAGNGAAIGIDNAGSIETAGSNAYGIFAQSIGGGGGAALASGTVTMQNGGTGNGGAIDITNGGNIVTTGAGADAIFAQSVGGGGGIAGTFAGSAGGIGSAGNVSIAQSGVIFTQGSSANGIVAQSAAGSGSGGNVNVAVDGSIYVTASNASGVIAGSSGGAGGGNVNVTLSANGVIVGGGATSGSSASSSSTGNNATTGTGRAHYHDGLVRQAGKADSAQSPAVSGAAVEFEGNGTNVLTNDGTITTLTGTNGFAVASTGGTTAIDNNGVMVGSISLANSANNSFSNSQNAVFVMGSTVNLGGGTLSNAGLISPGGIGITSTANVTGNFTQTMTGTTATDINFANGAFDQINVTGNATLSGQLDLSLLNVASVTAGTHNYNIITAGGTLNDRSLNLIAPLSAVSTYALIPNANGQLVLQNVVNFSPAQITGGTSSFGDYISELQAGGSSPALSGMIAQVFSAPSADQLTRLYKQLTPASYGPMEASTLLGTLNFSQQMFTCKSPDSDFASLSRGRCVWGGIGSTQSSQMESTAAVGYNQYTAGVSYGFQNVVSHDGRTLFGGAFSFGEDNLYANSSSMWGSRFTGGLLIKRENERTGMTYSLDVMGGSGNYQTRRTIAFPSTSIATSAGATGFGSYQTPSATSNGASYISFFNTGLRADKLLPLEDGWALTPYVSLNATRLSLTPTAETGAGALDIKSVYQGDSYLTLQSGFELGGIYQAKTWQIQPHLDIFATQFIGNNQTGLPSMLQGQPAWMRPFTFNNQIDRTLFNLQPTIDFGGKSGFSMRLGGAYQFSPHVHGGTLNVNLSQKLGPSPKAP